MAEPAERPRTVLRLPRVEFDLSALVLGAVGYVGYQWSWPMLASLLGVPQIRDVPPWLGLKSAFFSRLFGWIGLPHLDWIGRMVGWPGDITLAPEKQGDPPVAYDPALPAWKYVVVAVWLLVLWSVVAGAICRVYAVRFARDESIGAGDGLAFSLSNLKQYLLAPLFVAGAAALFLALAAAAGAGSAVPGAGPYLQILLQPLAFVAGLVLLVVAIGGVFGFPMMQAALSTERNGTLDAISRTFSYVFTRPVTYLVSVVLVTIVGSVIATFGAALLSITTRALTSGADLVASPSATAIGAGALFAGTPAGVLAWPQVTHGDTVPAVSVYVSWFVTALASIVVNGFVLSYFVGGLTDTYFLLRREVDGIDDSEVFVEGAAASFGEPLAGEPSAEKRP